MHARNALRAEHTKTVDKRGLRGIVYDIYVMSCEDVPLTYARFVRLETGLKKGRM